MFDSTLLRMLCLLHPACNRDTQSVQVGADFSASKSRQSSTTLDDDVYYSTRQYSDTLEF